MTIEERLALIRAGYSARDIANFEQAESFAKKEPEPEKEPESEKEPEKEPAPNEAVQDKEPAWAKALADSIKTLTAATQAANRRFDDMGEPAQAADKALEALKEIYGGKSK